MQTLILDGDESMTRLSSLSVVVLAACCCGSRAPERPAPHQLRNFDNQQFVQIRGPRGGLAIHEPFTPPITAAKIRTAIDDAVYYLRSQQVVDGSVHGDEGATSLTALTLLAAGADPAADDGLTKM